MVSGEKIEKSGAEPCVNSSSTACACGSCTVQQENRGAESPDTAPSGRTEADDAIPFFRLNIPNVLTMLRLIAVVPLAVMISNWPEHRVMAFILFVAIWSTDLLDGFIARRFKMITGFGKLFDPFVDKVFQVVSVIMLYSIGRIPIWIPLYYLFREALMLFGGTVLLTRDQVIVYSDFFGKISTFFFVCATSILFLIPCDFGIWRHLIFAPAVIMSVIATVHYGLKQWKSNQ